MILNNAVLQSTGRAERSGDRDLNLDLLKCFPPEDTRVKVNSAQQLQMKFKILSCLSTQNVRCDTGAEGSGISI